jgi:hypothetical protein
VEADKSSYIVREPKAEDTSFIFATWLRGLRYGNEMFELIPPDTYFQCYHAIIQKILTAAGTKVAVACLKDSPDVILGYAVYTGTTLHWCHVKTAWRNIGIAKQLVPQGTRTVTSLTKLGVGILKNHPQLIFNPFFNP